MKRALPCLRLVLAAYALAGCGMMQLQPPGVPAAVPSGAASYTMPKESQDQIRKSEQAAYARTDDMEDERLDQLEKDALAAVRLTLGKEKYADHMPAPLPASAGVSALRKRHVKMSLEPVLNPVSGQPNEDFLQLKDDATEKRELMGYSKIAYKLMDLRMQVLEVSVAAVSVNGHLQGSSLGNMLRVSSLVRSRKLHGMELDAPDIALVRRGLERQKRAEAIAATSLAMLAAYQAVINDNGDPRALDVIAKATLAAFPIEATVTDADAKAYVAALGQNVQKIKARYEAQMRKTWGDKKYEKQWKPMTDAMFASAEGAESQKSIAQIIQDNQNAVRSKPARGAKTSLPSQNADAGDALDASAKAFPGDSTIGASLQGISALRSGDPKGAIHAALTFVPVPGLKDAFGVASKMLFKT